VIHVAVFSISAAAQVRL